MTLLSTSFNKESPELKLLFKHKLLKNSELLKVIRAYRREKNQDKKDKLREIIFNNTVRFIRKQAWKYARANTANDVDDFFGAGIVGFYTGLDKFKFKKKVKFLTYIAYWIQNKMQECVNSQNILTIPRGDFYTHKERAQRSMNGSLLYLDATLPSEDEHTSSFNDVVADPKSIDEEKMIEILADKQEKERLMKVINNFLSPRERTIISGIYFNKKSMKEIALSIGLKSAEIIRWNHTQIIYKLRAMMKDEAWKRPVKGRPDGVARMFTEEQRAKISFAKRHPSEATRQRISAVTRRFPTELLRRVKQQLLAGKSMEDIAGGFKISASAIGKFFNNKLIYANNDGLTFTEEEKKIVLEARLKNKVACFQNGKK